MNNRSNVSNLTNERPKDMLNGSLQQPTTLVGGFSFLPANYVSFVLCSLGLITNALNVWVFVASRRTQLTDLTYKYSLVKSIATLVFLVLSLLDEFFFYCGNCASARTHFAAVYSIVFGFYISQSLYAFRLFIELVMSYRVFAVHTNRSHSIVFCLKFTVLLGLLASLLLYLSRAFSFTVVAIHPLTTTSPTQSNRTELVTIYLVAFTDYGLSDLSLVIEFLQLLVRAVFFVVCLGLLTLKNIGQYRKKLKKRNRVNGDKGGAPSGRF